VRRSCPDPYNQLPHRGGKMSESEDKAYAKGYLDGILLAVKDALCSLDSEELSKARDEINEWIANRKRLFQGKD